jgi:hypothetical protein
MAKSKKKRKPIHRIIVEQLEDGDFSATCLVSQREICCLPAYDALLGSRAIDRCFERQDTDCDAKHKII